MEKREPAVVDRRRESTDFRFAAGGSGGGGGGNDDDELVLRRLNWFLAANADAEREALAYRDDAEREEELAMRHPIGLERAVAIFGAMISVMPPTALLIRFASDTNVEGWFFGIAAIVIMLAGVIGWFTGKPAARVLRTLETMNWTPMLLLLPLLGLVWGIVTGTAAGIVFLVVGGLVGGVVGGMVGAAAVPAFGTLHRLMKKGESIERAHFLPIALGVTLTVCGFILGI